MVKTINSNQKKNINNKKNDRKKKKLALVKMSLLSVFVIVIVSVDL